MMRELAEMLNEYEEPFIVEDSRFEKMFGSRATPLAESVHATVRWFQEHKTAKQGSEF